MKESIRGGRSFRQWHKWINSSSITSGSYGRNKSLVGEKAWRRGKTSLCCRRAIVERNFPKWVRRSLQITTPAVQKAADRTVTSQRPQISKVGIKSFSEDFNVLLPCLARIFTVIPFFATNQSLCSSKRCIEICVCIYMRIFHHGLRTLKQLNLMQLGSHSVR